MKKGFGIIGRALIIIATAIFALVLFIAGLVLMNIVQQNCLIVDNFDLWLMISPWSNGMFVIEAILIIITMAYVGSCLEKHKKQDNIDGDILIYTKVIKEIKKYRVIVIAVIAIILYVTFINVAWIKDDVIYIRSTFNPMGTEHNISEISEINTGFHGKSFLRRATEGEFYYKVTLTNGKTLDLGNFSSEAERYNNDTYLSIEEFDKRVMEANKDLVKNSSHEYEDKSYLDKVYLDRFKRIIDNR